MFHVCSSYCFHFPLCFFIFFFNDPASTKIYTLSLHDALPIYHRGDDQPRPHRGDQLLAALPARSEEHTSELQSRGHLVCRLLLEKKKIRESIQNSRSQKTKTIEQQQKHYAAASSH